MCGIASQGGGAGCVSDSLPLRPVLLRIVRGCALLMLLAAAGQVHAGALYRCTGSQGEAVFTTSRAGYHGCHKISSYARPRLMPRRHTPPPPHASLIRVSGSAQTTAQDLSVNDNGWPSLAQVRASVQTSARSLGHARSGQPSLARVTGSAHTTAQTPGTVPAAGMPGSWNYRESKSDASPPARVQASSLASADRVLRGAVYRVVRPDGSVEYTNVQPAGQRGRVVTRLFTYIATCVACNLHSNIHWRSTALNLTAFSDAIRSASIEYAVDEAFLRAIIHAESAFNPRALSIKGAEGLMQLMPGTASDMGVMDAFNSDQNIRGGARYLSILLHDFNGNERLAAAAYNAGPGAVQRYSGVPPYAETRVYVQRVGVLRKRYAEAIQRQVALR